MGQIDNTRGKTTTRFLVVLFAALLRTGATSAPEREMPHETPRLSLEHTSLIFSNTNGIAAASWRLACTDSFVIYGGPGTLEGKFQDGAGQPDWQGWEGVDRTETPIYWQVRTHNAANLGNHGAGNRAYWCGQTAEQGPHPGLREQLDRDHHV